MNPYLMLLKENKVSKEPLTLREIEVLKYLNKGFAHK